jgi:hypothetical protein
MVRRGAYAGESDKNIATVLKQAMSTGLHA